MVFPVASAFAFPSPTLAGAGMPAYVALVFAAVLIGVAALVFGVLLARRLFGRPGVDRDRGRGFALPRPVARWLITLGTLATVALPGIAIYGQSIGAGLAYYLLGLAAFLGGGSAVAVLATRLWSFADRHREEVRVDEGGVRLQRRSGRREYVPFDRIADAQVVGGGVIGNPELRLVERGGRMHRIELHESPKAVLGAVLERIGPFVPPPAAAEAFARGGRTIDEWRRAIDTYLEAQGLAYRDGANAGALCAVVADPRVDPELRAGVAYALLAGGTTEGRTAVAAALRAAPPPIVVVMAAAAPGASSGIPAETVAEAVRYVEPERKTLAHVRVDDDAGACVRVAAEEQAREDAASADEQPAAQRLIEKT